MATTTTTRTCLGCGFGRTFGVGCSVSTGFTIAAASHDLPGWEIPKMRNDLFTDHYGFVVDYFAEALGHDATPSLLGGNNYAYGFGWLGPRGRWGCCPARTSARRARWCCRVRTRTATPSTSRA